MKAIYAGDSLTKDIYMATLANVTAVQVIYPKESNDYYQKLVDITSWTKEDFLREARTREECASQKIKPDYIIENGANYIDDADVS